MNLTFPRDLIFNRFLRKLILHLKSLKKFLKVYFLCLFFGGNLSTREGNNLKNNYENLDKNNSVLASTIVTYIFTLYLMGSIFFQIKKENIPFSSA